MSLTQSSVLSTHHPVLITQSLVLITFHFLSLRPAGPEGVEPATDGILLFDDVFEVARVEPDAAARVAAADAHVVVGILVEFARAARAFHRCGVLATRARLVAQRLAQAVERLLVLASEVFLFEAPSAFVENL